MMDFTPIVPVRLSGEAYPELIEKAQILCAKTEALSSFLSPLVMDALKSMLRAVNCYYSNRIEAEGAHPVDIEKAMKKEYAKDEISLRLQKLALAYIHTQEALEVQRLPLGLYSPDFLLSIHGSFYGQAQMASFLMLEGLDGQMHSMEPGKLRTVDVRVGAHIAPESTKLASMLAAMMHLYAQEHQRASAHKVIAALASHHRLAWLHPFADGNGRALRLFLDVALKDALGEGYGLWNISRGLARNLEGYKEHLKMADLPKLDPYDGKGALSGRYLYAWVAFMLETAQDQCDYITHHLRFDKLAHRLDGYFAWKRASATHKEEKIPAGVEAVLKELLFKGEIGRGAVQGIVKVSPRTANTLVGWMLKHAYVTSPSPKGVLRINFNASLSGHLFPDLVPRH